MNTGIRSKPQMWCLLTLLTSCTTLLPEDAAPASAFRVDANVEERFSGARSIIEGFDLSGERSLRDGDRVLVGVEVVAEGETKRHLLELIVHRGKVGESEGVMSFTHPDNSGSPEIPQRATRLLDLELVLRTPEGVEVERSLLREVPEFALDESFVDAIQSSQAGDQRSGSIAELRLAQIAQMLNGDPILQSLLREAASLPWDVTLLWRRELSLAVELRKACRADPQAGGGDAGHQLYELPFDLFLNDSLLVRMIATVTTPCGPSGALGGIVGLRAQDARNPDHHMSLHVLGASRGPESEWQQHGILAFYGYRDEGKGLSFSPNGRLVAMPGSGTKIEVRDLTSEDPTAARIGVCPSAAVDIAFLDDRTLLVATKHHVHVFDVANGVGELQKLAVHEHTEHTLSAIEVSDGSTAFLGSPGAGVECWQFAADRTAPPKREVLQAPRSEPAKVTIAHSTESTVPISVMATIPTRFGWLLAIDANHVLARTLQDETQWCRAADGNWEKQELDRVASPTSRRRRLPNVPSSAMFDRVTKGMALVQCEATSAHAYGEGPLSLNAGNGSRVHNRCERFRNYCHGFSPDGRYYAYVSPGYRVLVETARFAK